MGVGRRTVGPLTGAVDPAFWAGKRVLVTGHTGFKGAWLSMWLLELGAEVVGFSDAVGTQPSLFELCDLQSALQDLRGDVRDAEAVRGVVEAARADVVLHLAAQPLVRRSYQAPVETFSTNVMGTVHVLDAVRAVGGVPVTVVVTSDKCYENREWPWSYRETEHLGGRDPYSSSKACAELVTAAYAASFLDATGSRVATARAGNVIAGGDWSQDRLVPDVIRAATAGEPVTVRSPGSIRPWQHVLDCLSGYLVLAQALWSDEVSGGAWNFGPQPGDERTVDQVVSRLCGQWPGGISVHRAHEEDGPHEARTLAVDSAKARAQLGWRPRWDVDEAVDRVVEWHLRCREGEAAIDVTRAQLRAHSPAVSVEASA